MPVGFGVRWFSGRCGYAAYGDRFHGPAYTLQYSQSGPAHHAAHTVFSRCGPGGLFFSFSWLYFLRKGIYLLIFFQKNLHATDTAKLTKAPVAARTTESSNCEGLMPNRITSRVPPMVPVLVSVSNE